MSINNIELERIKSLCHQFRIDLITQLHQIQTGHPGGSLSACEIITTLYQRHLSVDPTDPKNNDRDRFILGKGHAAPMLYLNLIEKGFFPKEDFKSLRQVGSHLQGHPCMNHTPGIDLSTGPLGLGISAAAGIAAGLRLDGIDRKVYCLLGDGEIQEGIVWEAAMAISKFNLTNLICILDNNGVQLDGRVDEIMPLGNIQAKWEAFGFKVLTCDGHDIRDFDKAVEEAKTYIEKPVMIIANTVKGKGISYMEGKNIWHGKPIEKEHFDIALKELEVV